MSEDNKYILSNFNFERRQFLLRYIPGIVSSGYVVKIGIFSAALKFLYTIAERKAFAFDQAHYPDYYGQKNELEKSSEWQVRIELENLRLAAGEVCPVEVINDDKREYKLIGSLKRYESEPTNKEFFETFKKVIDRLHEAPRCYKILSEFNKENSNIKHEIHYHPYYVNFTYFMSGRYVHQMHVSRTFIDTSVKALTGTTYHELIAHGSQVIEFTNTGRRASIARCSVMEQWEKELEGNLIKWYAENEMFAFREIKHLHGEMKKWIKVFPEWNYFRINNIEKLDVEDLIRDLLRHYQEKYKNEDWVKTTFLNKLIN